MDDLHQRATQILQIHISKGKWHDPIFGTKYGLDVRGAFGKKQTDQLLVMLCEYVEKLEDRVKELEDANPRTTPKK